MIYGIPGTGVVGSGIVLRLLEFNQPVVVWNRTKNRTHWLIQAGAKEANTVEDLVTQSDVIITALTNFDAVEDIYDKALNVDITDKKFIEMSTLPPGATPGLAEEIFAHGARFAECPVSGSQGHNSTAIRSGNILGILGSRPEDKKWSLSIVKMLCRRVLYSGDIGSSALIKMAVNLPLLIYWQALGEALSICDSLNIDNTELLEFMTETSGGARGLAARIPGIVQNLNGVETKSVLTLQRAIDSLEELEAFADQNSLDLPMMRTAKDCYDQTAEETSPQHELFSIVAHQARIKWSF